MAEEKIYFRSDAITVTDSRIRISSADFQQSKLAKLLHGSHNKESIIETKNVEDASTFTPSKLGSLITIVIGIILLLGFDFWIGLLTIIGGGVWYRSRVEFLVWIQAREYGITSRSHSSSDSYGGGTTTDRNYILKIYKCYANSEAEQQEIVKAVRDARLDR